MEAAKSNVEVTGAGTRSAEGTTTGHENGEALASIGVRVNRQLDLKPIAIIQWINKDDFVKGMLYVGQD